MKQPEAGLWKLQYKLSMIVNTGAANKLHVYSLHKDTLFKKETIKKDDPAKWIFYIKFASGVGDVMFL